MGKLTLEIKKKVVQIAIDGGDPIKYLEDCGYTAPDKMWCYIKARLKEKDPETYAKIPDRRKMKKPEKPEIPEPVSGGPWEKLETPEVPDMVEVEATGTLPVVTQPVVFDGMIVREIEGSFGRYRRSDVSKEIYIDFDFKDINDTISMTVDQWRLFQTEMERAAAILGVEL